MKALIVYDSVFGNTEQVARAIGSALDLGEDVAVVRVNQVKLEQLTGLELLIVGSPTRSLRATEGTRSFLNSIPGHSLKGVKVAAFDTRLVISEVGSPILTFMVKIFGYAADPIAAALKKKGGFLVLPPEGFIVKASEGPLKEGELERAEDWAKRIHQLCFPARDLA